MGILGSDIFYTVDAQGNPKIEILNPVPSNKMVAYLQLLIPQALQNKCTDTWQTQPGSFNEELSNISGYSPHYKHPPDCKSPIYWDFCGGFGFAKFTLEGLILRNMLGFNRFSEDIKGYSWVKFLGYKFELIPAVDIDYLFRIEPHRATEGDYETDLLHPANLLNMPFVTWVKSIKRSKCCRPIVKRRRPPVDIHDWFDIQVFRNITLTSYQWTAFDSNNPMGKNPDITTQKGTYKWWDDSWMREIKGKDNNKAPQLSLNMNLTWWNRGTYDQSFVKTITKQTRTGKQSWWDWVFTPQPNSTAVGGKTTPFLPPIMPSEHINTFWFRYKFTFKFGGATISRNNIQWPIHEADDTTRQCAKNSDTCPICIKEGDLDEHGILTERAYQRITRSPERKKRKLVAELAKSLLKRNRKRVRWADDPGPSHPDPCKKKVLEYIRYLAARGR